MLNTRGVGAGSAALNPRLQHAYLLCPKAVKTFSESLLLYCGHNNGFVFFFLMSKLTCILQGKD